jgi:hypothetical protein
MGNQSTHREWGVGYEMSRSTVGSVAGPSGVASRSSLCSVDSSLDSAFFTLLSCSNALSFCSQSSINNMNSGGSS